MAQKAFECEIGSNPSDNEETVCDLVTAFRHYLGKRGYRPTSLQAYLKVAAHFVSWLGANASVQQTVNNETIELFVQEHLPICRCPHVGSVKDIKTVHAALMQLQLMCGDNRFSRTKGSSFSVAETVIAQFDAYLRDVCGLSDATRWYHRRHTRKFLLWLSDNNPLVFTRITPQNLCRFITAMAFDYRPGSIGVFVYSLRTFLKYLHFSGYDVPPATAMIPRPPNWSAPMPQALTRDELKRFLSAFDRATALGKRDYAMARCLTDLGLRGCEVANIQLHDIDWRQSKLHLAKTKNRRQDMLPLPETTAKALISYLHYGRPHTASSAVFVHHRAPLGQAVHTTTVRSAVRRAFSRAELPWSGPHVLRSTAATLLLEGGATLKEIADVLRHRSIDTTKKYMNVDLSHLSQVALPWPGRSL